MKQPTWTSQVLEVIKVMEEPLSMIDIISLLGVTKPTQMHAVKVAVWHLETRMKEIAHITTSTGVRKWKLIPGAERNRPVEREEEHGRRNRGVRKSIIYRGARVFAPKKYHIIEQGNVEAGDLIFDGVVRKGRRKYWRDAHDGEVGIGVNYWVGVARKDEGAM